MPSRIETTTDLEGRFRLVGIGRDRVATMLVSGPSIVTETVFAMTRPGPDVTFAPSRDNPTSVYHSPRFEHVAARSRPIRGIVRDIDTGKPIEGLRFEAGLGESRFDVHAKGVEANTDADGRYNLGGLPEATSYNLYLAHRDPSHARPYPAATLVVQAQRLGVEPVDFDFTLKRGVRVQGRVIDKAAGKPVAGQVFGFSFADNPAASESPGYSRARPGFATLDADSRYVIVLPAGRSLLVCRTNQAHYLKGVGAETIRGIDAQGRFPTIPPSPPTSFYETLAEVVLDPKAESATVDLRVDAGRSVELTVLDPDGQPIGGTQVEGSRAGSSRSKIDQRAATFEIMALTTRQPRQVVVIHESRKLAGFVVLRGDEAGPVTLKLMPWGELVGRIVDTDGKPLSGYTIQSGPDARLSRPSEVGILPSGPSFGGIKGGDDGRFRIVGLVPGLKYGATAAGSDRVADLLFRDVILRPGEFKDLGDIKLVRSRQ